jgi:hypothetical protein
MKAHITNQYVTADFPTMATGTARLRKVPDGPPDPENDCPALVAAERRADRKNSRSVTRKQNTRRPRRAQEPTRDLAIYSGIEPLGYVKGRSGRFRATLPQGGLLGHFRSLKAATDAISAHGGER